MIYLICKKEDYKKTSEEIEIEIVSLKHLESWLEDKDSVQLDTETVGNFNDTNGFVFLFQVGNWENQYVLDCTVQENVEFIVEKILKNDKLEKLLQNAKYDLKWFLRWGVNPKNIYDTMLAEQVLYCGYEGHGASLDVLGERYCGTIISKAIRGKINTLGLTSEVVEYAAGDVKYLHKIKDEQWKRAEEYELFTTIEKECEVVRVFAAMEYNGIFLNEEEWLTVEKEHIIKKDEAINVLYKWILSSKISKKVNTYYDMFKGLTVVINFNSSQQVVKLFNLVGVAYENKQMATITSVSQKDVLPVLSDPTGLKDLYINYKTEITNISKYGSNFLTTDIKFGGKKTGKTASTIHLNTGRVHCEYFQILVTGRVSCNNPNLQQIPSSTKHRNCFKPRKGYKFVSVDFSSQELVLIANDSGEKVWLDSLRNGWDLHSTVAEFVFGNEWVKGTTELCSYYNKVYIALNYNTKPSVITEEYYNNTLDIENKKLYRKSTLKEKCICSKHKKLRTSTKTLNYALAYGAGGDKIGAQLNIGSSGGWKLINKYFGAMSYLSNRFNFLKSYGVNHLMVRTFKEGFRRIRFFEEPNNTGQSKAIERESTNTRYQGTGADMMKQALIDLYDTLKDKYGNDVYFILQVHDQVMLEVKDEISEQVNQEIIDIMEYVSVKFKLKLPVKAEGEITTKWEH
jgi:DNA polymerase I-like protein with 3'-5' exonuclease and polymerase domains